jgi:hypothetical protein
MKILQRLRNRSPRGDAADPGSAAASSRDADQLPIPGYEGLDDRQVGAQDLMSTVRQPLMRERLTSTFERVEAARDEREQLREEARYRRERLDLYRARLYGGRAASQGKLPELQRPPTAPPPVFAGRRQQPRLLVAPPEGPLPLRAFVELRPARRPA